MKISFDDRSFIECRKSDNADKIIMIISAKDGNNTRKKITNAVEITMDEFKKLISDI
jgi:hypothetical protein